MVLNFLLGFSPLAAVGIILAVVGGRETLVLCGTLTPAPPCYGICVCESSAWLPFWNAFYLLPIGIALGLLLARFPRTGLRP